MLHRRVFPAVATSVAAVVHVRVKLNQRSDRECPRALSGADVKRTMAPQPITREPRDFTSSAVSSIALSASDDVVHNDAGVHLAFIYVLPKHSFAAFLLGPVNLFRAQRVAHAEGHGNAARAGADD